MDDIYLETFVKTFSIREMYSSSTGYSDGEHFGAIWESGLISWFPQHVDITNSLFCYCQTTTLAKAKHSFTNPLWFHKDRTKLSKDNQSLIIGYLDW